jgi:hypothetical protein
MAEGADVTRGPREDSRAVASLRQRIDSERRALERGLDELGGRVRDTMDWRRQAARHRGKLIAAGGGLLLAGVWRWRRRRQPQARLVAALTRAADAVSRQACEGIEAIRERLGEPPRRSWVRQLIAPLAMAALRAALNGRSGSRDATAGAERPTPPGERQRETTAVWNEEEQEWNPKSSSTIGA